MLIISLSLLCSWGPSRHFLLLYSMFCFIIFSGWPKLMLMALFHQDTTIKGCAQTSIYEELGMRTGWFCACFLCCTVALNNLCWLLARIEHTSSLRHPSLLSYLKSSCMWLCWANLKKPWTECDVCFYCNLSKFPSVCSAWFFSSRWHFYHKEVGSSCKMLAGKKQWWCQQTYIFEHRKKQRFKILQSLLFRHRWSPLLQIQIQLLLSHGQICTHWNLHECSCHPGWTYTKMLEL